MPVRTTCMGGMSLIRQRTPRLRAATFVAVLLMVFSACAGNGEDAAGTAPGAGEETGGGAESVTLEVTAVDNSFEPSTLSAPAGSEVTVELTNEGNNPHTFTIDDPDVDTGSVDGGDSATVTFTMPDSPVTFYCAIHGEDTMSGTLEPS